jgi:hypothetical protein
MKTQLTLDLEKTLYAYWQEQGATVVEEVTMPDDRGIVDTLVRQKQQDATIWRCFELKVTKADSIVAPNSALSVITTTLSCHNDCTRRWLVKFHMGSVFLPTIPSLKPQSPPALFLW